MYYLLWRGTVTGPFPLEKVKRMLSTRQISPLYKVSTDRQNWETIRNMPLFGSAVPARASSGKIMPPMPVPPAPNTSLPPVDAGYEKPKVKINSQKQQVLKLKRPAPLGTAMQEQAAEQNLELSSQDENVVVIDCPMCGAEGIAIDIAGASGTCRYCNVTIPLNTENPSSAPDEPIADSFPGYGIDKILGRGGMGLVYQASQTRLNNRKVALKVISPDMSANNQIENEVAALVQLVHPSIVTIFDLLTSGGKSAIVMELILGPSGFPLSLRDIINVNGAILDYAAAISACRSICAPVAYAHKHGIFHLDLKPENILIDHLGHIKIVDFGIARFDESGANEPSVSKTISSDQYGTIGYSAPERLSRKVQPHANQDVYSLGVILYELLMGAPPEGRFSLPSEVNSDMPTVFDSLIETALNYHPDRRFSSMEAFDHALANAERIVKAGSSKSKKITVKTPSPSVGGSNKSKSPVSISVKNFKVKIK